MPARDDQRFFRVPLHVARADPRWRGGRLVETAMGTMHAVVHGEGPDVVLVHGVTDHALTWHELGPQLGGMRVHAIDLPGHGLSDVPSRPLTPRQMSRWVAAYLDAADVASAVMVGWSLGAAVSAELCVDDPRVRAIVFVGGAAVPSRKPRALRALMMPLMGEAMIEIANQRRMRRITMLDTYGWGYRPSGAVLDRYFLGWIVAERPAYMRALLRELDFGETCERLPQLRVPVWSVQGTGDRFVPLPYARRLARLSGAKLVLLEGVGHAPHLERPDQVVAAIRAALAATHRGGVVGARHPG